MGYSVLRGKHDQGFKKKNPPFTTYLWWLLSSATRVTGGRESEYGALYSCSPEEFEEESEAVFISTTHQRPISQLSGISFSSFNTDIKLNRQ